MPQCPQIALGSAQWGMAYGIANRSGAPDLDEVSALLARAAEAGVRTVDTARTYGESERLIGRALARLGGIRGWRIVTKLRPCPGEDEGLASALESASRSLAASREALGVDRLSAVLLHRPHDRTRFDGEVWALLRREQTAGRIGKVGISALRPEEAWEALEDPTVELVQVASSLLDRRLWRGGFFEAAARLDREIHVRSVFLQGVAFLETGELAGSLRGLTGPLACIDNAARRLGVPRQALFLAFARRLPAQHVVLGFERAAQLEEVLEQWPGAKALSSEAIALAEALEDPPASLVDPAAWPDQGQASQ